MIRFSFVASLILAGTLLAPAAIGQEPSRAENPPGPAQEGQGKVESKTGEIVAELDRLMALQHLASLRTHQNQLLAKRLDPLEANFGLSLSDADDALRAQLEIPQGQGVVVVGVKPGSLAEHAGLKLNDVLLSLGDQNAKGVEDSRKVLLGLGREALEVKLIREGKPRRMSLVGPEHGFPPEAAEFWIGVPVSPVDSTLRSHLPTLPADSGLIVNDVVKGSPADQVSVQKNDVLVSLNDKPLTTTDALIEQIQASQGKPVPLHLLRGGKPMTITITPAKRAHPTVINLRRNAETPFSVQLVRPGMAIEVERRMPGAQPGQEPTQAKPGEAKPQPAGTMTFYWPFPNSDANTMTWATAPHLSASIGQGFNAQAPGAAINDASTARIEGQLKEVMAKLAEIQKSLDSLKKPAEK